MENKVYLHVYKVRSVCLRILRLHNSVLATGSHTREFIIYGMCKTRVYDVFALSVDAAGS